MYVISQDHDRLVKYNPEKVRIGTIIESGKLRGFGLYHPAENLEAGTPFEAFDDDLSEEIMLGSFDTPDEAEDCVDDMNRNEKPFYIVPGFYDYEE